MSEDFPDPPTPEIDAPTDPSIYLPNDLTFLLDSLNPMFVGHPKVGHHLRALFMNVGYRSYWGSQRGSMAHVAEDINGWRVMRNRLLLPGPKKWRGMCGSGLSEKPQGELPRPLTTFSVVSALVAQGLRPIPILPAHTNTSLPPDGRTALCYYHMVVNMWPSKRSSIMRNPNVVTVGR